MVANPWSELPLVAPFIAPCDQAAVDAFNRRHAQQPQFRLRTELMPEPYLGSPNTSTLVLLNLNPGFADEDVRHVEDETFRTQSRRSLLHQSDCPFYLLDPRFADCGGYRWWSRHLAALRPATDRDWRRVTERVMVVELYPYHSQKFGGHQGVPSQDYSLALVKDAMANGKVIVFMRAMPRWVEALPELASYPTVRLNSPQSPYVSPGNMALDGWQCVQQTLE
jgi:hypothetical protein